MSHGPRVALPTIEQLRGWVIAYATANAGWFGFITTEHCEPGSPIPIWCTLSPVYVFAGMGVGPQGRVMGLGPVELLQEVHDLTVRPIGMLRLAHLGEHDFQKIARAARKSIEMAETIRTQVHSAESGGISLVPAGVKLPPMPQGPRS